MRQLKLFLLLSLVTICANAKVAITNPKTEMLTNPVGIDYTQPRVSWQYATSKNNLVQQSYRILVASTPELLNPGKADLWDSGVQQSDKQTYIAYEGKSLQSRQRAYWKVIAKTNQGKAESEPQYFEMGLLNTSDWQAEWIGDDYTNMDFRRFFRRTDGKQGFDMAFYNNDHLGGDAVKAIQIDELDKIWPSSPVEGIISDGFSDCSTSTFTAPETADYEFAIFGDDGYRLFIDGQDIANDWGSHSVTCRYYTLHATKGQKYAVRIEHYDDTEGSSIQLKVFKKESGVDLLYDKTKVRARYMRKGFDVNNDVEKATLYISGMGLYEAYLNGQHIGEARMVPGPTDYSKSVMYNTYDVTSLVDNGKNVLGVVLGNGRFVSMRIPSIIHYGMPMLMCQLEITMKDGSKKVITSDTSWQVTHNGPIGYNNEYDGEEFSLARYQQMADWTTSSYIPDNTWHQVFKVDGPKGTICAQDNPPLAVQEHIRPLSIKEVSKGVYVMDMGQNMVGHLKVMLKGNEGDTISLHFAETLQPDGNIYTANLRTAETTDHLYLKGATATAEPFAWEPSFTYHGFRFVELRGFKEKPQLDQFEGEVVYDAMQTTGTWECSNKVLTQVYNNAYWGIRGNYRGMPTDCPQRDERFGWLGDRAIGCYGESYIFDNHHLYSKWVNDIEESELEDGQVPGVSPAYGLVYQDDVTWPSCFITSIDMMYRQFGDDRPIREHYDGMKKFMVHIHDKNMEDGMVLKDCYGDWCVPPESPELIHSNDPARKTDGKLLSTAFYYMLSGMMENFARVSGHTEDIPYWQGEQKVVKSRYADHFLNKEKGYFSNNTVTANILSWRLGLTPKEYDQSVKNNFISKCETELDGHVSCGLIGVQQLMRGLTDAGRGDLAFKMASTDTYPSYGYMAKKGATTIWELWNGDTADPAMNSGNHVMLLGDLVTWLYQYLGGIGQTKESAGFSNILLKPYFIDGLDHVNSSYDSVYGKIVSNWKHEGNKILWHIEIPAGRTATVEWPDGTTSSYGSGSYDIEKTL